MMFNHLLYLKVCFLKLCYTNFDKTMKFINTQLIIMTLINYNTNYYRSSQVAISHAFVLMFHGVTPNII